MEGDASRKIPEAHAAELSVFYEIHARWLFGHACVRTQRDRELVAARELAADLVQDTFVAAALNWEILRDLDPARQRAWLRRTLSNKETDHFRRRAALRRKQPEVDLRYGASDHDPELQALAVIALEAAKRIIEGLPTRQRRIALMKWDDHMKGSEIADEMDCAPGTVAAQVHEIRRKLINGLGPYYPFASEGGEGQASR